MSWAVRRRILYLIGVFLFLFISIGLPIAYHFATIAPTCTDGIQNQDETGIDMGGICPLVDYRSLSPVAPVWARSFRVRDGSYTAASYIQNSNDAAGADTASYIFKLYDSENVLIAERTGATYIMPGGITPVVETNIDAGNRIVTHTFFEFTSQPIFKKYKDVSKVIRVDSREITNSTDGTRVGAQAHNTSVTPMLHVKFTAVVFDTSGNALGASETELARLDPESVQPVVFTWPTPFAAQIGRVDILPVLPPKPEWH